jgi:hypothetical protein
MTICCKILSKKFKKKGRKCCLKAADRFQGIPHSYHSSQVFIIPSFFNEHSSNCFSLTYISISQYARKNKNTTKVKTLISWPLTSSM